MILLIIVDNYCNFTCLEEGLVALEASGEWAGNRTHNLNRKNKLIRPHITNFWAYKKLQLHNKSERPLEERLLNNIQTKEEMQKNLKSYQVHMMFYPTHKKGNCMISMVRKVSKTEDHLEDQALETCSVAFSVEVETPIKAQEKESQDFYKYR